MIQKLILGGQIGADLAALDEVPDPKQPGQSEFAFSLAPAAALHAYDER